MTGGLTDRDWQIIKEVFAQFPEVKEAFLFGSRAKGNYKRGSDVDIALKGDHLSRAVTRISANLNEESPLPYCFDVLDYKAIASIDLLSHIDRVGVKIYP